jgi:hypothetical protein
MGNENRSRSDDEGESSGICTVLKQEEGQDLGPMPLALCSDSPRPLRGVIRACSAVGKYPTCRASTKDTIGPDKASTNEKALTSVVVTGYGGLWYHNYRFLDCGLELLEIGGF